jgi:ring-1,2-phenylacetyl-CoA epoxidase subunit PaaE
MNQLYLRVTKIATEVTDAILISLEEDNGEPVPYLAGQFLTFIIDYHGKELRRSYSICSTPGIDESLTILVKRIENGAISRYLIDHLKTGDVLKALPPGGRFTLVTNIHHRRIVFFLAAGSGISPVFSLLKKLLLEEPLSRAILIFQNRDETTIIFGRELALLQDKFKDRLIIIHLLSNPVNKDKVPRRLNNALLEKLIGNYLNIDGPHDFYLCGPLSFMRMIQFVLKVMGVKDEHIRKENFVIDTAPPVPFISDTSPKQIKIKWKDNLFKFSATYPETILQAALNNNIQLPYSCRAGRCASCTLTCVSGKVKLGINEVLTLKDLSEGLVLTCVGYAETDLVLEI